MKILLGCVGNHFPSGAFRFIKDLHDVYTIAVKGIIFSEMNMRDVLEAGFIPFSDPPKVKLEEKANEDVNFSKNSFIESCKSVGITYTIDEMNRSWDSAYFVKQTRFADLVVISDKLISNDIINDAPKYFIHESLRNAECPVVAVPENYQGIERIIVGYDGKKECMFALKQFTHMFPAYSDLPIELVYIKDEEKDDIPDSNLLREYSMAHFDAGNMLKLHYHSTMSFSEWLKKKNNVILITGSFSRSGVSMLLKESFVEQIVEHNAIPVFIAHNT